MTKKTLSHLSEVLDKEVGSVFHVGIDVHKRSDHVGFYGCNGYLKTFVGPADPRFVVGKLTAHRSSIEQMAYEAGPTGFELARQLKEAGLPVLMIAPSRVPRPVTQGAKTNRLESRSRWNTGPRPAPG